MVDEQFPLQRKILKGQVAVRNEGAGVNARREMNRRTTGTGWLEAAFIPVLLFMCCCFFFFYLISSQGHTQWGCTSENVKLGSSLFLQGFF